MTVADNAEKRIEEYLETVVDRLRGIDKQDAKDFIQELHSHIREKISAAGEITPAVVEKVLVTLGDPNELAYEFSTTALISRTEAGASPVRVLSILFRLARFSLEGLLVFLGTIVGYFVGSVLFLCAMSKPFHPHAAGLWSFHDPTGDLNLSFSLGSAKPPAGAHELLGWWIVPIGLLAGFLLVVFTSRLALWCTRKIPRSKAFQQRWGISS